MPDPLFVLGSDTSQDAAENLQTRARTAHAWIELASRPEGATVRDVVRYLNKHDSGPSARQGELANEAEVLIKTSERRERCSVYVLRPGLTIEQAKEVYDAWVCSDAKPKGSGRRLPDVVVAACRDAALLMCSPVEDPVEEEAAKNRIWEAIRRSGM